MKLTNKQAVRESTHQEKETSVEGDKVDNEYISSPGRDLEQRTTPIATCTSTNIQQLFY